jgi:hypothetical protein
VEHDLTRPSRGPRLPDPGEISVEPVDRCPRDGEPTAAVHPRPPPSAPRDGRVGAGDVAGQCGERGDVQIGLVVEAEVDVGLRGVLAAGPAAAEQHAHDSGDLHEPVGQRTQCEIVDHHGILPGLSRR